MRTGIVSAQYRDVSGCSLTVDKKNRVILSQPEQNKEIFDEVLAVTHQGDHFHRSSSDTAKTLLVSFSVEGWSDAKV